MRSRCLLPGLIVATAGLASPLSWAQGPSPDPAQLAIGKALFTRGAVPACAVCHTLKDAGAEGNVGPSLDEMKPDAARVATAMRNGIGAMPSFKPSLTDAQIQAVALYVSTVAGR